MLDWTDTLYYILIRDPIDDARPPLLVRLTYSHTTWGRDPWRFQGTALAGVSANEYDVTKPAGVVNMYADFSGRTKQLLFKLNRFSTHTSSPAVGAKGSGWYYGPTGLFAGDVEWEMMDVA